MAEDRFIVYGDQMALLYDVIVDPSQRQPGPMGGEKMEEVWGQKEESEYIKFKEGFFLMPCTTRPAATFQRQDHLVKWMSALRCADNATVFKTAAKSPAVRGLTIAVQRYEYVNLYHTMTDFYNAFLAMVMFAQAPDDVTVLWVDAHPRGGLDDTWATLFGRTERAGRLEGPTRFSALAWAAMSYASPLNQHARPRVDYLPEFRHFFLSRHGVDGSRTANCSALSFLFVWRRDYAAHPRNKGGVIGRKIDNEDELVAAVRGGALAHGDSLRGLQLDALPMKEQLRLVAATDVLVGMHGAGLSHTLFLPSHAGLIELYPTYWPQANRHFRCMASWRKLHYRTWQNHDSANEKSGKRTYVPPTVLVNMVKEMRALICP